MGRLLSVTNAIEAGTWRQGDGGWAPWKRGGGGAPRGPWYRPRIIRARRSARPLCGGTTERGRACDGPAVVRRGGVFSQNNRSSKCLQRLTNEGAGWGWLLSVRNAVKASSCGQGDSGWTQTGRPWRKVGGPLPRSNAPLPQGCMGRGGGKPPFLAYAQPLSTTPSCNGICNRQ